MRNLCNFLSILGFPHSSVGKDSSCSAGDPGLIPESGRSPGAGKGNPLQHPCLSILLCTKICSNNRVYLKKNRMKTSQTLPFDQ